MLKSQDGGVQVWCDTAGIPVSIETVLIKEVLTSFNAGYEHRKPQKEFLQTCGMVGSW